MNLCVKVYLTPHLIVGVLYSQLIGRKLETKLKREKKKQIKRNNIKNNWERTRIPLFPLFLKCLRSSNTYTLWGISLPPLLPAFALALVLKSYHHKIFSLYIDEEAFAH